jgi:hypothetical protein
LGSQTWTSDQTFFTTFTLLSDRRLQYIFMMAQHIATAGHWVIESFGDTGYEHASAVQHPEMTGDRWACELVGTLAAINKKRTHITGHAVPAATRPPFPHQTRSFRLNPQPAGACACYMFDNCCSATVPNVMRVPGREHPRARVPRQQHSRATPRNLKSIESETFQFSI